MAKRKTDSWIAGDGLPAVLPAGVTNEWGGNLRNEGRPILLRRDANGLIDGYSTTSSTVVPAKNGGYAVIPTVVDGKDIGSAEAYRHYLRTGEHWGTAATIAGAEELAQSVHERHMAMNTRSWNEFISESLPALSPVLRRAVEESDDRAVREAAKGGRANVRPRLTASMRANSARFAAGWYQDAQGNWVDPSKKREPVRRYVEQKPPDPNSFFGGTQNAEYDKAMAEWGKTFSGRRAQALTEMRKAYAETLAKYRANSAAKVEADASAARRAEALRQQRKAAAEARVAEAPAVDLSKMTVSELTQTARNVRNFNDPGHARRTNQANAAARARDPYGATHLVDFSSTDPAKLKRQAARNMQSLIEKRQVTKVAGIEQPGIVKTWDTTASAVKTLQTVKASDLAAEGAKRTGAGTARLDALTARADKSIGKTNARISRIDEKMAKLRESLAEFDKMATGWETKADRTASTANPTTVTKLAGVLAPISSGVRGSGSGPSVGRPREYGRQVIDPNGPLPGGMATPRVDVGRVQPTLTGSSREDNLREATADEEARRAQQRPRRPDEAAIFAGRTKRGGRRASRAALLGGSVATGPRTTSGPRTSGIGIRSFAPDLGSSSFSPFYPGMTMPSAFRGSTWAWTRANGMTGSFDQDWLNRRF